MMADVFGNYIVERALGAGSFATVWLAHDPALDTHVAVKVLADNWSRNADVRRRFIEEARILRQISHDGVVRVFLIDELDDERPYFVMEWADRGTLFDRMNGTPWNADEATAAVSEVLDCLTVVHDFGVVHRDIKPSNVLYRSLRSHERASDRRSGRAERIDRTVLGDFGLAKNLVAASGFTMAAGTPAYMAPEQARTTSTTGPAADVYSTGAVLFELLTGKPPFDTDTLSDIRAGARSSAPPMVTDIRPDLPLALGKAVDRALAPLPADRFASAYDMAQALRSISVQGAGQPSSTPPISEPLEGPETEVLEQLRSGTVTLPAALAVQALQILTPGTAASRLGASAGSDRSEVHRLATDFLDAWNTHINTGRLPFSARPVADAVIAVLERLWLDTQP